MSTSSADVEPPAGACHETQIVSRSQLDGSTGKPYIVVSDVHLGGDRCCVRAFGEFLDWLYDGINTRGTLKVRLSGNQKKNSKDELEHPRTLILLGDILELWAPKNNEHRNVLIDSLRVFGKLMDLPCCKVYVLGNHDMTVFGWDRFKNAAVLNSNTNALTPFDLECKNKCHFKTKPCYYPCDQSMQRALLLSLGKKTTETTTAEKKATYLFVHGQQFDPTFQAAGISARLVPLIAGLASAFEAYPRSGPIFFAFSIVAVGILAAGFWIGSIPPLFWLAVGIFCGYPGFSWLIAKQMKHVWDGWQQLIALIKRSRCIKSKNLPSWPWPMPPRSKMRYKRIDYEQISDFVRNPECIALEKGAIDSANANKMVVVYGHTHVPALSPLIPYKGLDWQFANCGSWLQPLEQEKRKQRRFVQDCPDARDIDKVRYNTFVYIDENGPRLFQWTGRTTDPEEIPLDDYDSPPATGT